MSIKKIVEIEKIKAEFCALSTIREDLFKQNKNLEAVVIIAVQNRLEDMINKLRMEIK